MSAGDIKVGQLAYEIVAKVDGSFHTNISKAETNVKGLGSTMDKTNSKAKGFGDTLVSIAKGVGLVYLGQQILNFGKSSVQAFSTMQQSLIQFNNAQQNVNGTTKEAIDDMNDYILALEKKTSIDDKTIRQASQIYAQDQLALDLQKKLLQGTIDLAVANSKASGNEIDVSGTAKALGLAIATGDLGRLTKQNIAGITETQKALFKTGTDAERTAILMKVLDENAKGAGEALGNSFQGKINKAKDAIEDLQIAIGQGLAVALPVLVDNLSNTTDNLELTAQGSDVLGGGFVKLAGLIAFVLNSFKLLGQGIIFFGKIMVGLLQVEYSFVKDSIGLFTKLKNSIFSIGDAMLELAKGNFKEAKDALKTGFDFSETFTGSKDALDKFVTSVGTAQKGIFDTTNALKENIITMQNGNTIYKQGKIESDALTQAKDNLKTATVRETEATEASKNATAEAKKKLEDFNKTLVDTVIESQKTSAELKGNLTKSFEDFSQSISDNVEETRDRLAEIVVEAEEKKKELRKRINSSSDGASAEDQEELARLQKTIDARVGYEDRASKQIELIRNKIKDAGLDPSLLNANLLASQKSFEDELKEQRIKASEDEFTRFENEQNRKLTKLTEDFIAEALIIQTKINTQKAFEADLTNFITSENRKRLSEVELFASQSLSKYGQMASSLRSIISLQNQINSFSKSKGLPQFHDGGFVGGQGGEVHAGEFVVPASIVSSNPALIGALEKMRNQTNNITINTQNTGGDLHSASEELLWRLGRV